MVLLRTDLPAQASAQGTLAQWEALRRAKYNFYEGKIRNSIEGIQKIHMSSAVLNFFFPSFGQAALSDLEVYRRLQTLGDYTPEEVAGYKSTHCANIELHLQSTFGTRIPTLGLALGLASGAYLAFKPVSLGSLFLGTIPFPLFQFLANKWNPKHKYETLKFLDWAEQQRISKYLLEKNQGAFPDFTLRDFRRSYPTQTLVCAYNDYLTRLETA
jgi:hypothetical protein